MSLTVVVFPFVPVTETTGIVVGAPGGYSMSMIGAPTLRGSPSVGCVCMRTPGAALTSMIAAPF
jgi:hypothetical protein